MNLLSNNIPVSPISYAISWTTMATTVPVTFEKDSLADVANRAPTAIPSMILCKKSDTKFKYPTVGLYFQLSIENIY